MDKVQTKLVNLLNASVHGEKIDFDLKEHIEWEKIIEESKEHKVEALSYSAIGRDTMKSIDKELLRIWKKDTFISGVSQLRHINNVSEFLGEFNKQNIPVIVLKGLVIRDLYPKPELRTMCDADILVHKKDLDTVKKLLLSLGYTETVTSDKDLCFIRGNTYVEVHWTIANDKSFDNVDLFEKQMWENVVQIKIGDSYALSMSDEDLLVHMCMHMASHIKYMGFGIRQLCDLVLMVEKRGDIIDWDSFIAKLHQLGIYKFATTIFIICNKLFDMEIPDKMNNPQIKNDKYVDLLIAEIFACGVHGKRDKISSFTNVISYANKEQERSTIKTFKKLYFPSRENLGEDYNYAKENNFLLPIAWGHRLFRSVLKTDYNFIEKLKIGVLGISISNKRNKLINWLEL